METKPKTNADRIRHMTDEELAEFLAKNYISCARCFFRRTSSKDPTLTGRSSVRRRSGCARNLAWTTTSRIPCGKKWRDNNGRN